MQFEKLNITAKGRKLSSVVWICPNCETINPEKDMDQGDHLMCGCDWEGLLDLDEIGYETWREKLCEDIRLEVKKRRESR